MSWNWTDISIPSITVPDSTVIFQSCFTIIGRCESTSTLRFSSSLTPLEAIKVVQDTQYAIPSILVPGQLQVETCTPTGLQVIADCGPEVNLGDEVCVKVRARGMQNINQFTYLMNFNANILEFKDVNILATPTQIPNFNKATHFNTINAARGVLGVNWNAPVPSVLANAPDNTVIYEVCFKVIGLGGNAPRSVDAATSVVRRSGSIQNIGIAPSNCAVRVKQPESLLLRIGNAQGAPGDSVCVNIEAANSQSGLTELEFSLLWDPLHVTFAAIKNIQIPGAALSNFETQGAESGLLSFSWTSATPFNLNVGTRMFQVCYMVVGDAPGALGEKELRSGFSDGRSHNSPPQSCNDWISGRKYRHKSYAWRYLYPQSSRIFPAGWKGPGVQGRYSLFRFQGPRVYGDYRGGIQRQLGAYGTSVCKSHA
jgi:hypothetical protein